MSTSTGSRRRTAFTTLLAIALTTTAVMAVSAPSFAKDGRPGGATAPNKPKRPAKPPKVDRGKTDVDKGRVGPADQTIADDLIVQGSVCAGFDCVTDESFGFDTIRLKENNTRIAFDDTSAIGFPANDWQILANDSASGGLNYLAFEDTTAGAGTQPFRVEAGAGANALYVKSGGNVGLGTSTPVLDLDIATGNTPAIRLGQNASGGFTAQTWDVAGNEANFFVRDVTGGSRLPFRIRPGAPTSSIDIAASGNVGIGTASPTTRLHLVESGNTTNAIVTIQRTGTNAQIWELVNRQVDGDFAINTQFATGAEFIFRKDGKLEIKGGLITGTAGSCDPATPCDGVFSPEFTVESIDDHAAYMWQHSYLEGVGPTPAGEPMEITRKVTGMLNELEKAHIYIEQLHGRIAQQDEQLAALEQRLTALEAQVASD